MFKVMLRKWDDKKTQETVTWVVEKVTALCVVLLPIEGLYHIFKGDITGLLFNVVATIAFYNVGWVLVKLRSEDTIVISYKRAVIFGIAFIAMFVFALLQLVTGVH